MTSLTATCRLRRTATAGSTASRTWARRSGRLGAVAALLALAVGGLVTHEPAAVRGVYLGMEVIGWFVIVPLSFASLLTGLIQSLTTEWGLFRHYWILATLLINVLAASVLLVFMQGLNDAAVGSPRPTVHAGAALMLLFAATALSVYKPRGVTPYGWRKQRERRVLAQQGRELT